MDPHTIVHAGCEFELRFEHADRAWTGIIYRDGLDTRSGARLPDQLDDLEKIRDYLIRVCEEVIATSFWPRPRAHDSKQHQLCQAPGH